MTLLELAYPPVWLRHTPGGHQHNQLSHAGDLLDLAGRIDLGDGESLVSSGEIDPTEDAARVLYAVVDSPKGPQFRLGVLDPDGGDRWRAGNKGATANLSVDQARKLRNELASANDLAKRRAREADKAWNSGTAPTDPVLLGSEPVIELGQVDSAWGAVKYNAWLNDDESSGWEIDVWVSDAETADAAKFRPKELKKLLAVLDDFTGEEGRSAAVDDLREITHMPAGSPEGGQFAPGGQKAAAKPAKKAAPKKARKSSDTLAYDPDSNTGTGYGMKGGDHRVRRLQEALTRLGLTDAAGKKLAVDGKLGPKTTAAVKKAQKRLGLEPDGKVTPESMHRLMDAKALPGRSSRLELCTRSFDFELRAQGDGRTLEGFAATYNTPARIRDLQGDFEEVILPGAFTRSVSQRMPVMQWDHGKDPRVGTVPIASIKVLDPDHAKGLFVRARLFDNPVIEPVRQAIAEGAVRGMSFRFGVPEKGDVWTRRAGDVDLREIRDADVHEVGPVVFPAYDTTSVSVRSLLAQLDPDEYRSLLRELAAELRAADLTDFVGRPDAWRSGGDEPGARPGDGSTPQMHLRQRLDHGALRARGILK